MSSPRLSKAVAVGAIVSLGFASHFGIAYATETSESNDSQTLTADTDTAGAASDSAEGAATEQTEEVADEAIAAGDDAETDLVEESTDEEADDGAETDVFEESTDEEPADETSTVSLLNFNDFHGRMTSGTAMKFAKLIEDQRAVNDSNTLLLSSGDDIGASEFVSSVQNDEPAIDFLNALELDASTLGNHEFDKGVDDLLNRVVPRANFDHIAANVTHKDSGETIVKPYEIYTTESGITVGVVGAVTQETTTLVSPAGVASVEFHDPVESVNKYIEQLSDGDESNGEADIIVASYHEGVNSDNPAADRIVNETHPEADVIFSGHSHRLYSFEAPVPGEEGKTRPVLQSEAYAKYLARVDFTVDAEGNIIETTFGNHEVGEEPTAEEIAANPRLAAANEVAQAAAAVADEKGSVKLGEYEGYITTGYLEGDGFDRRDQESTMGHLVADAWLWAGNNNPAGLKADIGILAAGSLRNELPNGLRNNTDLPATGDVTVADAVSVNPFANDLFTVDVTGAQLKEILEQQWQESADGSIPRRPYLQLALSSNVTYTFTGEVSTDANDNAGHATRGENIDQIWVNRELVQDDDVFTLVAPSFLTAGGDNFRAVANGINHQQTALIDTDAFQDYIEQALEGKVTPRYNQQALRVVGLEDSYNVGENLTFELPQVGVRSFGAVQPESLDILVIRDEDGESFELGSVDVVDGAATVDLPLGEDLEGGEYYLLIQDLETGTEIYRTLELVGTDVDDSETTGTDEEGTETPTPTATDPVDTTESGAAGGADNGKGGAAGQGAGKGSLASTGAGLAGLGLLGAAAVAAGAGLSRRRARH